MQITAESATIGAAALGAIGGLLVEVYKRGVARAVAREQVRQAERAAVAAKQKEQSAEQIKAEEADKARQSKEFWHFVGELNADRDRQERRIAALEQDVHDLRADLEQVSHIERQQRAKVERLTSENTALRDQVERLKAENAALHQRLQVLERKTDGDAPTAPAAT